MRKGISGQDQAMVEYESTEVQKVMQLSAKVYSTKKSKVIRTDRISGSMAVCLWLNAEAKHRVKTEEIER